MSNNIIRPAFIALFIANCMVVISFTSFFLFPIHLLRIGGSEIDIGIIMGCFAGSAAFCRPWVSEMIDSIGRWRSYFIGCLSMCILPLCYLLLPFELAAAYPYLILLRLIHGIALAISFTAAFTFIADIVPSHRMNEGIGLFGVSGLLATGAGPALGELVLNDFGISGLYLLASGCAAIAVMCHIWLEETGSRQSTQQERSFFSILLRQKMLRVALLSLIFGIGIAAYGNFIAPLAAERGVMSLTPYYLLYAVAAVITRFGGGRLTDTIGEGKMVTPAMIVTGAGFLLLSLSSSLTLFMVAGILSGVGHGLLFPTLNTLAVRGEVQSDRGKVTGIFTGSIDMGAFVGAYLLGGIGEWFSLAALFTFAGGSLLTGAVLAHRWRTAPQTEA